MVKAGNELERAMMAVKGKSEGTTQVYRLAVRSFLDWCRESGEPVAVDTFTRYIEGMKKRKGASYINQRVYAVKKAFTGAAKKLNIPARELAVIKTALADVKAVKQPEPEITVIDARERERLFDALPVRVRLVAEFLYMTGARVSEATTARMENVKVNGRVEILLHGKGGKDRRVKITRELFAKINAEFGPMDREYLFATKRPDRKGRTGNAFPPSMSWNAMRNTSRKVLDREIGPHDLRHSRATDLIKTGNSLKAVSTFLGHAGVDVTAKYYVNDKLTDEALFQGLEVPDEA